MLLRTAAAVLFATALVTAQTAPNLVGITLNTSSVWEGLHGACTQLTLCPTGQPTSPLSFLWEGGSAWDSQTGEAWASNGNLLGRYATSTCTASCLPIVCPRSPGADVSGLDVWDAQNELWVLDSQNVVTRLSNNCARTVLGTIPITGLPLTHIPTGISIDELRGLVFIAATDFASPQGDGRIFVAPLSTLVLATFQNQQVVDCFTPAPHRITGLAVDGGNRAIYWTDGRNTYQASYVYTPPAVAGSVVISFTGSCCINMAPLGDPLLDLSIHWGGATSTGTPCASGTCPNCPMLHTLRNAPLLGTTLQLGLDLAPVGVFSWCMINFGSCVGNAGTFPPLCGPIMVPFPVVGTLGPNVTTGGGPCTGTTTFLLPLPANPIFAGTPMSSQCVALCPPTGITMSNCLSWVLQ